MMAKGKKGNNLFDHIIKQVKVVDAGSAKSKLFKKWKMVARLEIEEKETTFQSMVFDLKKYGWFYSQCL